MYEDVTILFVT